MIRSRLHKVGDAVMLDMLALQPGAMVGGLTVESGRLVVTPQRRYMLSELLAQCDHEAEVSDEDWQWDRVDPVGRESL